MSQNIKKLKYFLFFLTDNNTPRSQSEAVLEYIDEKQLQVLLEIIFNILHGTLRPEKKNFPEIKRNKKVLRELTNKTISTLSKKRIIKRRKTIILKVLKSIKKDLRNFLI